MQGPNGLSRVTEHAADGCQTWCPCARADPDSYRLKSLELWKVTIHNCAGQRRHRAGAARHRYPSFFGLVIEYVYSGYELPAVRQVHVMATGVNGSACDGVVLTLKRSGRMNDRCNPQRSQLFVEQRVLCIDADALIVRESKPLSHAAGTINVATPDEKPDGWVACERTADACSEKTGPAYYKHRVNAHSI